jgi:hypothetical protein
MASIINASTSGAGGLIQTADSSGVLALQSAGATIASVSGTGVAVTGNVSSTGTVADSLGTLRPLVSGTAKAYNWNGLTTNTVIDFTSIPSWAKRVTILLNGVSTNGTSVVLLRVGSGGTAQATGYVGNADNNAGAGASYTTGLGLERAALAAYARVGVAVFTAFGSNTWIGTWVGADTGATPVATGATTVTLSGALDTVQLTTVNGTDTFDAGTINIMYE